MVCELQHSTGMSDFLIKNPRSESSDFRQTRQVYIVSPLGLVVQLDKLCAVGIHAEKNRETVHMKYQKLWNFVLYKTYTDLEKL